MDKKKVSWRKTKGNFLKSIKIKKRTPARTCFTVSCKMAHLSGLTDKELMSAKLAEINSANSSMYMFSCSRRLFSLRHLFLKQSYKINS